MKLPIRKTSITIILLTSLSLAPIAPAQADSDSMFLNFGGMIDTAKNAFRDLKMWLETKFERATDHVDEGVEKTREEFDKAVDWSKDKVDEGIEAYEKRQSE